MRSFPIYIGMSEAKAIQPWLKGAGSVKALDPYTSCVRALNKFGWEVAKVTVSELKAGTFYAMLKLKSRDGTVDVDCRPSDGLNFAARAKAPIFADSALVEQSMSKGKDGKPLSPEAAWRNMRPDRVTPFRNLSEILQAIEKNPENQAARTALATGWERVPLPKVKQRQEAAKAMLRPGSTVVIARMVGKGDPKFMEELEAWRRKCEGTNLEGVAAGLIGAVHLWPPEQKLDRAIPLLEKARRLQPEDERIAFDLATAFALSGRTEHALSVLPKGRYDTARSSGNFQSLWSNARFRAIVGEPEESHRDTFISAQLDMRTISHAPGKSEKKLAKQISGLPSGTHARRLRKPNLAQTHDAERLIGCGPLVRTVLAATRYREEAESQKLVLGTEQERAPVLELDLMDFGNIDRPLQGFSTPRPMTNETFCNLLRSAAIQIESVVLTKRGRSRIEAALIASRNGRREVIALDGPAALSIAFTAKRPVLIAEPLAERLYLRGRTGKALSAKAVVRRLCKK